MPSGPGDVMLKAFPSVFVDPPIVVEKADLPWITPANLDQFGSSASMDAETQTAETTPRAWWLNSDEWKTFRRELK